MVSHLALLKARPDLSTSDRRRLIAAFERAAREIPTVRHVRVGQRITHGAGYEARMPDTADYFVMIDFEDAEGLAAYLHHPAHEDLGMRFNDSLAAALVYDFEEVELDSLMARLGTSPLLEAEPPDHPLDEPRSAAIRRVSPRQDAETLVDGLDEVKSRPSDLDR
jgi:hypothetical protein